MNDSELIPHLFRTEFSKLVSVICKTFGLKNIQLAEDLVSDTFLKASETWGLKGIPPNPAAWLYMVAKNLAKDYFKRDLVFQEKISPEIRTVTPIEETELIDFSESNIKDSQLRMIFAVCHPVNPIESQVALSLRVLCGFGVNEIASALLSSKENINKKLYRAKEKLRSLTIEFDTVSKSEIDERLDRVVLVLYLLFNEGYYSQHKDVGVRKDLCLEAMRLCFFLTENKQTNTNNVNALLSLFCFHSSRFESRIDKDGSYIILNDQDRNSWDIDLIKKGEAYLAKSTNQNGFSKYHLEAMIAYWHTRLDGSEDEKWENILTLYNRLLQLEYSPVAALNRTYALFKVKGVEEALNEALKINLKKSHLYHCLLAEFYKESDVAKQIEHLTLAKELATSIGDIRLIEKRLTNAIRTQS
jgi:RNA polymerase sigma-70 factor (ECF subfamily)